MFTGFAYKGHAVPLEPEHLAALSGRRDLETHRLAGEIRHFGLSPQHRGGQGNPNLYVEIVASSFEPGVRRDMHPQIEVSRCGAAAAVLAFARHAYAGSFTHPCGNSHIHRPRMPAMLDGEAAHRAVVGVFEGQIDGLFHVAALAPARRTPAAPA